MEWLRVSNPVGVVVILTGVGLTVTIVLGGIVWSLYQGFLPEGVKEELVESSDLAELKRQIFELEAGEKALKQEPSEPQRQNSHTPQPLERPIVAPPAKQQKPPVRSSQPTTKETPLPKDTTAQSQPLNQFRRMNYPKSRCGDPLPTSPSQYPVMMYPVFVDYSEQNLDIIKRQFCRDAFEKRREEVGITSIQVASFVGRQRAEEFRDFIKSSVGSGEVGEPTKRDVPPARQEPVTKTPESINQQSERSYIGLLVITLTPEVKAQKNNDPKFGQIVWHESGVLVEEVVPRSPAAEVGFLPGDVIHRVAGRTVTTSEQVQQIVQRSGLGKEIGVEFSRNLQVFSFTVRTEKAPVQYYPE